MTPDKLAPLVGLSVGMFLAFGTLVIFCLFLSALVPFTLLTLKKQSQQQLEVLLRIEGHLAHPGSPGAPGVAAPPPTGTQPDPANVN